MRRFPSAASPPRQHRWGLAVAQTLSRRRHRCNRNADNRHPKDACYEPWASTAGSRWASSASMQMKPGSPSIVLALSSRPSRPSTKRRLQAMPPVQSQLGGLKEPFAAYATLTGALLCGQLTIVCVTSVQERITHGARIKTSRASSSCPHGLAVEQCWLVSDGDNRRVLNV